MSTHIYERERRRWPWILVGILGIILVALAVTWFFLIHQEHREHLPSRESRVTSHQSRLYICPMHPSYTSDQPGTCPICGMTLVLAEKEMIHEHERPAKKEMEAKAPGRAPIKVTDMQRQVIGVKTALVKLRTLTKEIRTVGIVAYDPDLAVAQREYIEALKLGDRSLARAAQERLELLGMSGQQIGELKKTKQVQKNLYLPAPGGKVWIYGEIYESDIPFVSPGQEVAVTVPETPEPKLIGVIAAIDPVVNPKTRSVRIRSEVDDPENLLKPNLYVDVAIRTPLGKTLAVPIGALMWSDRASYVFVDEGNGRLVPRKVTVGQRTRDYAQILGGLKDGESVVVSANFLVDAESQLKATLKAMTPGKGKEKAAKEHVHVR